MTSSHTEAPHKTPTWPERLRDVALLLACAVPLLVLFRLISTGLYSTPETDDFCFSYHYAVDGLFGTVALFYKTAIGRILPMVIMTLPAMLSRAIPLDMFIVYPLMMAAVLLAFIAVCMWVCNRLWPAIPGLPSHQPRRTLKSVIRKASAGEEW